MNKSYIVTLIIALLCMIYSGTSEAAKAEPGLQPVDFSCRGVYLGDSEEKLLQAFGQPMFDKETTVWGQALKTYCFDKGYDVSVSKDKKQVVDIRIKDKKYTGRNGVRHGATKFNIYSTFGKVPHTLIEGESYNIYANPANKRQRLILHVHNTTGYLEDWRITSLPLSEEEADAWAEDDIEDGVTAEDVLLAQKKIDVSDLPVAEAPQLKLEK